MFKIMGLAQIQMHQGPHSDLNDYGVGVIPYKKRVKQYLEKIKKISASHFAGSTACGDCKSKKQANKFPPRENVVRYVDKASSLVDKDINECLIFASVSKACKFIIGICLRQYFGKALRHILDSDPNIFDRLSIMSQVISGVSDEAFRMIELPGQ
jgi:hypothetical protein